MRPGRIPEKKFDYRAYEIKQYDNKLRERRLYRELLETVTEGAEKKDAFFRGHLGGYIVSAMWAGAAVGIGMILMAAVGAYGEAYHYAMTKPMMGFSFSVALSIVLMWGLELFTGSNMVMTVGALRKRITWRKVALVWVFTYVGNLIGAMVLSLLYSNTGLDQRIADYILKMAQSKTAPAIWELLLRGILCNVLVCLAVLICYKMKSESGRLIMIFWCIYTFVVLGFEHSVANMTLFSMTSLLGYSDLVTPSMMLHNMIPVTIGNILGGGLVIGGSLFIMGEKHISV